MAVNNQEQSALMNSAMNMGLVVGGYYIAKFCLFPLSLYSSMAALLFLGLTFVVPFLIYHLTKRYRDHYQDGYIGFTQALLFAMLIMGFGSLLVAVAHYVYFAFIDGGAMVGTLMQSIDQLRGVDLSVLEGEGTAEAVAEFNQYVEVMEQTAQQLQAMSPIEITMGMLSNNVSWSVILSLPIALLTRRNKPEQGE